jgi:hypothetical protein
MVAGERIDYSLLAALHAATSETWNAFVRGVLVDRCLTEYDATTPWETEVIEITQGELTFLFDGAPTLSAVGGDHGEDRVVAVWGRSAVPDHRRDRARLAGFIPNPLSWSAAQRDRGHFVAHAAGGGLDVNLFPQAASLNRGRTDEGRRWRRMERYAALHPGTPLFVRPSYDTPGWAPAALDYGLLAGDGLWSEGFANRP